MQKYADVQQGVLTNVQAYSGANEADIGKFTTLRPESTLFTGQCFKRVTPFAVSYTFAPFENAPTGTASGNYAWATARTMNVEVPRNGDLLGMAALHLHVDRLDTTGFTPASDRVAWVNEVGHAAIQDLTVSVSSQVLDRKDGLVMHAMLESGVRGPGIDSGEMIGRFEENVGTGGNVSEEAIVFASTDRHLFVDLQMFHGHRLADFFSLLNLQHQQLKFEVTMPAWVDLVRAWDQTNTLWYSDTTIRTNIMANGSGQLFSANLLFQSIYLGEFERKHRAAQRNTTLYTYTLKQIERSVAADTPNLSLKLDGENATHEHLMFYRRTSATGSGTGKEYFDFGSRIEPTLIPGVVSLGYWPVVPFEKITLKVNDHERADGPGEFFHLFNAYAVRKHKLPASYVCTFNFNMVPTKPNVPSGYQNETVIDNVNVDVTFRRMNATLDGLREAGTLWVYSLKYNVYAQEKGQLGVLFPTH